MPSRPEVRRKVAAGMAKECLDHCPLMTFYRSVVSLEAEHEVEVPDIIGPDGLRIGVHQELLKGSKYLRAKRYRRILSASPGVAKLRDCIKATYDCTGPEMVKDSSDILTALGAIVISCPRSGYSEQRSTA